MHRIAAMADAAVIALTVGATRADLGVHWLTGGVAGWALGRLLLTIAVIGLAIVRFRSHPTLADCELVGKTRAGVQAAGRG